MINANEIADLKESGCRTIQGRVSREYFERAYFGTPD